MIEFNRIELRALLCATGLVVTGAIVRVLVAPGAMEYAWRPAAETGVQDRDRTLDDVERALEAEERAGTPLAAGETIDPNRAPVEELRRLPGIGPTRAAAIAQARSARPFLYARDLLRVPGIGEATLSRIAPHLTVAAAGGPAGAAPLSGRRAPREAFGTSAVRLCGPEGEIDLNRADAAALTALRGIGPALAERIVRRRGERGRFESVTDLLDVRGIGPATLQGIGAEPCSRG